MKKILKIILLALNAIIVIFALCVIIYFFGIKTIENKYYQKGANDVIGAIVNQIEKTGEVSITKNLILIKKNENIQENK